MDNTQEIASDLRFDILRNAIYHTARAQFMDQCNKVLAFLIIAFGTSAAAQLGAVLHIDDRVLAAAAALVATLQLVGDFGVSARNHSYLQRRCYELLSEVEKATDDSAEKLRAIRASLVTLYGEEPPPMRALDAIAYNAACDSLGKYTNRVKIGFWQSLLRQLYPFNGTEFVPRPKSAAT